jgi:3-deoxy-D-arabino-heptulosonate 7-phosphate (DAHP) synthase
MLSFKAPHSMDFKNGTDGKLKKVFTAVQRENTVFPDV